jgi:anti-sigma-K factor RskA
MRVILLATAIAIVLAIASAVMLDRQQVTVTDAFTTTGVRL